MIWIWLLVRNSHKWGTGALDRYFSFVCARCGVTTPAMVRSFGYGTGSNHMAAMHGAHASADAYAYRAVAASACPSCAQLQPHILDGFQRAAQKVARRRALRIPVAAAVATLALILLAIPAAQDMHHSMTLSVVAVSTASAIFAMFFAIFTGAVVTPPTDPAGVWFSRDPNAPGSWFPAQPGPAPFVAQPAPVLRVLSKVAFVVTTLSAVVALVLWTQTFRKVYVVSSEGRGGNLAIRIDGGAADHLGYSAGADAPYATFEVRTSSSHRITVTGKDGQEVGYDLDPATAKHGWVLAPHARDRDLCLASIKWYYGTTPKEGDDALLGTESDLVVLPRSFDHYFTSPPSTVQTKNGSSETRTSLRALDCASLRDEKIVPFNEAPPPRPVAPVEPAEPVEPDDPMSKF